MNRSILISALFAVLSLSACDKPTVVNVPSTNVPVPGPAGPAGEAGKAGEAGVQGVEGDRGDVGLQGNDGTKGEAGKAGEGTTVIVTPPAAPAN